MAKMGLTKEQLKLVQEFKDTDEYKQLQYKYIAIRSSGKRASIKDKLIELAKKFVDKYKDKLPKLAYEILVKKFARRFQDYMEDVAKPILAHEKANPTATTCEERSFRSVRMVSDALNGTTRTLSEIALENISLSLAKMANSLANIETMFKDAMFVKEGDLVDRKTKKPKHVGWSWLHSIQSELAQLRGLTADKKDDDYTPQPPINTQPPQYVPVPYQLPYPPPPWSVQPDKPWWQQPESPSYPTITCRNSADTNPTSKQ
jgi:hypothetical protein